MDHLLARVLLAILFSLVATGIAWAVFAIRRRYRGPFSPYSLYIVMVLIVIVFVVTIPVVFFDIGG